MRDKPCHFDNVHIHDNGKITKSLNKGVEDSRGENSESDNKKENFNSHGDRK